MSMPEDIRRGIKEALWEKLDQLSWLTMSDADHSTYYEQWAKSPDIGGKLGHFMDPRAVRVYIKDTLVKDYARERLLESGDQVLRVLNIDPDIAVERKFIKPHGMRLSDGRVVCWGKSRDWKHLLMAAFERQWATKSSASSSVVIIETGKTLDTGARDLVREAAARLGVGSVVWWE
ncbi:hypothetical protein [Phaeobacter sp. S60]|uniref:hypothetical protein n=1 Tax=Phaeobacter sp. S60 TaxID=1569353 RepID=UPI00058E418E|nr:hypothetical protein [Phaeobacter sp. S60]KII16258.1 hypothetical protein OO25_07640 [Phaeobacter sp. S60]